MKKLDELKLSEIENLTIKELMAYNSSGAESSGASGDNSGWWKFCKDECTGDANCAEQLGISESGALCNTVGCFYGFLGNYKKCFAMTKWEQACKGKDYGDICYVDRQRGRCASNNRAKYCYTATSGGFFP